MTRENFAALFPIKNEAERGRHYDAVQAASLEFSIHYSRRLAAFLAQVGHETAGFRYSQELGDAAYFARYEGRRDLGNTEPGDGARYHGRGMLQLTGRANYREFGGLLSLPLEDEPERAATVEVGARIAGLFWRSRGCNDLADQDRFRAVTRKINGGLNGLEDRLRRWDLARLQFGLSPIREAGS